MTVQWTVHIPQAMQRHGASIKPCADAACDNTRAYQVQQASLQSEASTQRPDDTSGTRETAH